MPPIYREWRGGHVAAILRVSRLILRVVALLGSLRSIPRVSHRLLDSQCILDFWRILDSQRILDFRRILDSLRILESWRILECWHILDSWYILESQRILDFWRIFGSKRERGIRPLPTRSYDPVSLYLSGSHALTLIAQVHQLQALFLP